MNSFTLKDTVAVYGEQRDAIQAMLDYDYMCGKSVSSVRAIINPSISAPQTSSMYFYGSTEVALPVFRTLERAMEVAPASILINFASARSAFGVTEAALSQVVIEKIIVIAEGMPEREARLLRSQASQTGKIVIGPATVGGLITGVVKVGYAGGTIENIIDSRLFVRGNVGIVSKSGGMLNEFMTMVSRATNGVAEAIAIGGDRFPLTNLVEQVKRFAENPEIKLILMQGEIGGTQEYAIAELLEKGAIKKPLVAWISGTGAESLTETIQFGHAGAMANSADETAVAKLAALKKAGAQVPHDYAGLEKLLHEVAVQEGIGAISAATTPPVLPQDFAQLMKRGELRYPKRIVSSISKKRGGDETYFGHPIDETAEQESLGYVLGLLWFKKEFPASVTNLFELMLKLTADHGPSVSGAHNTIVTARAGKNLVDSLIAGLLPIGPRFGGAVNDAAHYFKWGKDQGMSAFDFVQEMKDKGLLIPGIGHKVKSKTNPDKRVALLIREAKKVAKELPYLEYALKVEEVTTRKKDSLILNVDGAMAVILLDVLSLHLSNEEVEKLVSIEAFNAFFVLGRSIGLIGHFIDQKRLDQPLYRHPEWDILEID